MRLTLKLSYINLCIVIVTVEILSISINEVSGTHGIITGCNVSYTGDRGHTCYPCSPGHYKVADCLAEGEQARCAPCPAGTFQPHCSVATSCVPCTTFCRSRRQVIVTRCSKVTDSECRCRHGYVWHPHWPGSREGVCLTRVLCQPGYGLKTGAAGLNVCSPCVAGVNFSMTHSLDECRNCTVCDRYSRTCSPVSDALCDPPSTIVPRQMISENRSHPHQSAPVCGGCCQVIVVCTVAAILLAATIAAVWMCKKYHMPPWKTKDRSHHPDPLLNNQAELTELSKGDMEVTEVDVDADSFSLKTDNNNSENPPPGDVMEWTQETLANQSCVQCTRAEIGRHNQNITAVSILADESKVDDPTCKHLSPRESSARADPTTDCGYSCKNEGSVNPTTERLKSKDVRAYNAQQESTV